jgi:hypothetical protein
MLLQIRAIVTINTQLNPNSFLVSASGGDFLPQNGT